MNPPEVVRPLLFVCAAFCVDARAATVFNFDGDNVGTYTPFTDTVNGLSATFSSPADPGGFVIYANNGFFDTLTGNVLGNPGPAGLDNLNLSVAFSQNQSSVSLDFATFDYGSPSPLTIDAYQNSTLIGSMTATGAIPTDFGFVFPEGQISFSGAAFNNIVISSGAPDFVVDNISVSSVPSPPSSWLLAAGVLALAVPALRRRISPTEKEWRHDNR